MRNRLFFLLSLLVAHAASAGSRVEDVTRLSQANFQEYLELLRVENIPAEPANMRRNADFLKAAFEKRGFEVRLLENGAKRPLVFAQLAGAQPQAKTLLFYAHFDGQPVIPSQWTQRNPFEPVVKKRNERGEWQEVERDLLFAQPLDPELRVFARSSSDDKGPIMMLLTAIDVLRADNAKPAVNIKVLLDSEEEISSPSLAETVRANLPLFAADGVVVLDGPLHASGQPTLVFGNRGITQVTLTVFGPKSPLHSGHYGNYAPNPAQRLATLLASMKDDKGRVLIPGYYDGVQLTDADRALLGSVDDDEEALNRLIGIARPEGVGASYQESLQYPSLNIRGMASAAIGASAANILPSEAIAELDLRTTPETDGRKLFGLIRRHVEAQGFHLVDGTPSDEDRAKYDKLASLRLGAVQAAQRMPIDSPLGRWAYRALQSPVAPTPKTPPVRIRMMGGTVPMDILIDALRLPCLLVPTVNSDNNQHARDENLRMGNFITGTETILSLMSTAYD